MTTEDSSPFQPGCTVRVVKNSRDFLPEGIEIGGTYWYKYSHTLLNFKYATLVVQRDGKLETATMYEEDLEVVEEEHKSLSADWTGRPDTTSRDTW